MSRRHLLGIEQLNKDELYALLRNASELVEISDREIKKVPALRGKTIINLFLEPSTRTRTSFEIAAKRLSADAINVSPSTSSTVKGETLLDTARTLQAMTPDVLVIRHGSSGAAAFIAQHLKDTSVVNAGDGMHEHPTQALLDCLSLIQHFHARDEGIEKLKICIVGDILHSRVARSTIFAHRLLGNEIRLVGPSTLVPESFADKESFGPSVKIYHDLRKAIEGVDVIMCLRLQLERQSENYIPSLEEYTNEYFVSEKLVTEYAPHAAVMHPGPVNRGVEVESKLIDGPRSLMTNQVRNGIAVRMAVLFAVTSAGVQQGGQLQ